MPKPFTIAFAIYEKLTQLDFTGPFEVLSRIPGAKVIVASAKGGSVTSDTGLTFSNLAKLSEVESCDLICLPGGGGQVEAMMDSAFMDEIRRLGGGAKYVTSVCTGSLILAASGLIAGKRAASHWAFRHMLTNFGVTPDPARVVRDGNLITGGGVTAGIDFALTVAAEVAGPDVAQAIQLSIEYSPSPPFNAGRPETAPPEVLKVVEAGISEAFPARKAAMEQALAN